MKLLQVDRFEGEIAVLFDCEKNIYDVKKDLFGFELHEGDLLNVTFVDGKPASAEFLAEETERLKKRAAALREKLRRKK
jgi:hypothetical protein